MMKMILDLFEGGHSVSVYGDAGVSAVEADETTDVQEETEVTLTVTLKTGYEIADYEVIAGGVTVDPEEKTFEMGDKDVVICVKTKADNLYRVTEECFTCVNGAVIRLHRNTNVILTKNGAPVDLVIEGGGAAVASVTEAIKSLIDQGILVKI